MNNFNQQNIYDILIQSMYYKDGHLYWKNTNKHIKKCLVDKQAGRINHNGYRTIKLNGNMYMEHRLVWLYHHKSFPLKDIDHINRDKQDNRIENLRECNDSENSQNRGLSSINNSGVKGVSFDKRANKWRSTIKINGKQIHIGRYKDFNEAVLNRKLAEEYYHPYRIKEENNGPELA